MRLDKKNPKFRIIAILFGLNIKQINILKNSAWQDHFATLDMESDEEMAFLALKLNGLHQ